MFLERAIDVTSDDSLVADGRQVFLAELMVQFWRALVVNFNISPHFYKSEPLLSVGAQVEFTVVELLGTLAPAHDFLSLSRQEQWALLETLLRFNQSLRSLEPFSLHFEFWLTWRG